LALTLLRQVRAAGIAITAVVADAEFGDCPTFRRALHRLRLAYAVGVSSTVTVFVGPPVLMPASGRVGPRGGRPTSRRTLPPGVASLARRDLADTVPALSWRTVNWRNGANAPWRARFWACRVTPEHEWRRVVAPAIWLLCQRDLGATPETKYYFVHLPATASLKALVRLAHQRWAIEQEYAELKDELGLDHIEGRSYDCWYRLVALTAIAYAFLQCERLRRRRHTLTFPQARAVITDILTAHYFLTHRRPLKMFLDLSEIPLRI
jgi:SRSO17 transposase